MSKGLNSRAKGNRTELAIAKRLSEAWNFKLVRTPNSGAFKNLAPADIIPEDRQLWVYDWPFHIEVKNRVGWSLEQLISSKKKCSVIEWWNDEVNKQIAAVGDKFYDKEMLLIFTKNHDDVYVMFERTDMYPENLRFNILGYTDEFLFQGSSLEFIENQGDDKFRIFEIVTLDVFLKSFNFKACQEFYKLWIEHRSSKNVQN